MNSFTQPERITNEPQDYHYKNWFVGGSDACSNLQPDPRIHTMDRDCTRVRLILRQVSCGVKWHLITWSISAAVFPWVCDNAVSGPEQDSRAGRRGEKKEQQQQQWVEGKNRGKDGRSRGTKEGTQEEQERSETNEGIPSYNASLENTQHMAARTAIFYLPMYISAHLLISHPHHTSSASANITYRHSVNPSQHNNYSFDNTNFIHLPHQLHPPFSLHNHRCHSYLTTIIKLNFPNSPNQLNKGYIEYMVSTKNMHKYSYHSQTPD